MRCYMHGLVGCSSPLCRSYLAVQAEADAIEDAAWKPDPVRSADFASAEKALSSGPGALMSLFNAHMRGDHD